MPSWYPKVFTVPGNLAQALAISSSRPSLHAPPCLSELSPKSHRRPHHPSRHPSARIPVSFRLGPALVRLLATYTPSSLRLHTHALLIPHLPRSPPGAHLKASLIIWIEVTLITLPLRRCTLTPFTLPPQTAILATSLLWPRCFMIPTLGA